MTAVIVRRTGCLVVLKELSENALGMTPLEREITLARSSQHEP